MIEGRHTEKRSPGTARGDAFLDIQSLNWYMRRTRLPLWIECFFPKTFSGLPMLRLRIRNHNGRDFDDSTGDQGDKREAEPLLHLQLHSKPHTTPTTADPEPNPPPSHSNSKDHEDEMPATSDFVKKLFN